MRKIIKTLLLLLFFVIFPTVNVFAAETVLEEPTGFKRINIWTSSDAYIHYEYTRTDNLTYTAVYNTRSPDFFAWRDTVCTPTKSIKLKLSGDLGKITKMEVVTCDGTSTSVTNPFPDPPEPPEDGDNGGNPTPGGNLPPTKDWGEVDTSKPANACGQARWTNPIRNWVDDIFCPVITFLDLARAKLAAVSLMMGQGLNIGKYFSIFGDLPLSWQLVVSSLLLMVATLGGLLIFRSAMRIYYSIKEGVKWW